MLLSVINSKGGVGKTTTTVNLGEALALQGKRVLVVDLDRQAHAAQALGITRDQREPSIADVLFQGLPIHDAIRPSTVEKSHSTSEDAI
jgi:chromosome partitioning protein